MNKWGLILILVFHLHRPLSPVSLDITPTLSLRIGNTWVSTKIKSIQLVPDDSGTLIYSAAHGPYGDIQKEWVTTYDPKQKFSGKERENYSDLDYFGARYYDNHSYRFISVDPIMNRDEAIINPQLWNLYSYCKNNPITFIDPFGLDNYVFYDPDSFSKQANVEAERLEKLNAEKTHLYGIKTEKQFVKKWNSMKEPKYVTLLFHSTSGETAPRTISIDWTNDEYITANPSGEIVPNVKGTPINSLSKKTLNTLNLYICHSGETENNIALAFSKAHNIQTVVGVKGPFNYRYFTYVPKSSNKLVYYIMQYIYIKLVK